MSNLKGKVAVVTGASKGIGAGIAKALAQAGAAVAVNYASDKAGAQKLVDQIEQAGGKAVAIGADLSRPAEVAQLFDAAEQALGKVDVLVNNAGVFKFSPLEEVEAEEFHRQFNTNVLGTILATKEALRHFKPGGGSVINLSSIVGQGAIPGSVVYSATKGAIDTATRVLAAELGPRNIRVNAISPGMVETEGTHAAGFIGSDFQKHSEANAPLRRIGQPQDIAQVAVYLASDESGWLTGQNIAASGGARA